MRRIVSGMMFILLLIGMLTFAFNIQPVKASGTIYIRADGSVEPATANITTVDSVTYTFTANNYDEIVVERSNIIIDGDGYTLQGSGSGSGFYMTGINNVKIQNTTIKNFHNGVRLDYSSNITVSGNNITNNNWWGIKLYESSNITVSGNNITNNGDGVRLNYSSNITVSGNNITNNGDGVLLCSSSNSTVSGNNITNNDYGVSLYDSSNNVLRNNVMAGNPYNFGVYGNTLSNFVQDVDDSNTVDGKPIYYWVNRQDMKVPSDAGFVAVVNSSNITVEELELKNNGQGVLLAYATNSQIRNNNITNNGAGVRLWYSSNNTVSGNNITNNYWCGVYLFYSSNITVSGNNIANSWYGVYLWYSSNNTVSGNNITNNGDGVWLYYSSNITVSGNNITNNNWWGIKLGESSNITVSGNNITNNGCGVYLGESSDNKFYHNNFIDNTGQVYIYSPGYANFWDDGYSSGGNYWSDYSQPDEFRGSNQNETNSDGIVDAPYVMDADNQDRYPLTKPYGGSGDIGITNVTTSKTVVGQGYSLNVSVKIINYGTNTEAFNVTLFCNTTSVQAETITLTSRNSTTITFTWNTTDVAKGNYTIWAYAEPVPDEIDLADNTLFADEQVCITIPGDVDGDFDVDLYDAVKLLVVYGAKAGSMQYDPNLDINSDGKIDLYDAVILLTHYGQKDP